MGSFLSFLMVIGGLVAILGCFVWLASRVRRRGVAGEAIRAALASYEEGFHGTAYAAHYEIQAQRQRQAPMPSPDDKLRRNRGGAQAQ
jgi:hypothetical protein